MTLYNADVKQEGAHAGKGIYAVEKHIYLPCKPAPRG